MSRFMEEVARRKQLERLRRQQELFAQVMNLRMTLFPFGDARWLNKFFDDTDPSDADLLKASGVIRKYLADHRENMEFIDKLD